MNEWWINKNGIVKDGWYLIKLGQSKAIEGLLPPTRCACAASGFLVQNSSVKDMIEPPAQLITKDMVESPAYTIGQEYEFSNGGGKWFTHKYHGYSFGSKRHQSYAVSYKYCRPIQPKPKKTDLEKLEDKIAEINRAIEVVKYYGSFEAARGRKKVIEYDGVPSFPEEYERLKEVFKDD